ncbi:SpoVG family protein [bacterium]|nr:SpoVG family protein [bacterium]MCP5462770.1 septation protein SpoVG family protein [bacterium]
MEITEIRIYPKESGRDDKLKAFATITIDNAFVIRDLKIIAGKKGLFIAMPSTKTTAPCPACRKKNPIRNRFCGFCGINIEEEMREAQKHEREDNRDIAHPINAEARDYLHSRIMAEYYKVKSHGYTDEDPYHHSSYSGDDDDE